MIKLDNSKERFERTITDNWEGEFVDLASLERIKSEIKNDTTN